MKWQTLLSIVGDEPVFTPGLLITDAADPAGVRRQFSRWVSSGRLIQIRRGLYALAEPYCRAKPHPFLVANRIKRASYVSLQSALEYYGLIPEFVPSVTSVTTGRPESVVTPLGQLIFRHIKTDFFRGYRYVDLGDGQEAFIAAPEKALLDLLYLTPGSDNPRYIDEIRLQNVEILDMAKLLQDAQESRSPKLSRAARKVVTLAGSL
ncbi:type IV toxin-antitoxin system AbiEi family antitoxin domain-containing protein [Acidobacteriota bacterium]